MPIREYVCKKCHQKTEIKQGINEPISTKCSCGGKLRQVYSPFVIFMGKMPISGHRKWQYADSDGVKP